MPVLCYSWKENMHLRSKEMRPGFIETSARRVFVEEGGYQDGVRVGDSYLAIPRDSFAEESGSRAQGATYK